MPCLSGNTVVPLSRFLSKLRRVYTPNQHTHSPSLHAYCCSFKSCVRQDSRPTLLAGQGLSFARRPLLSILRISQHLPNDTLLLSAWLQLLEDPVILLHRTPLFKASFPFFVGYYLLFHACALFYQYTHFLCECTFVPIHTIELVTALPTVAEGIQEWLSRMGCVKIGGKFAEVERPVPRA